MKFIIPICIVICLGLIGLNATKLNTSALFEGDSMTALITIAALACAILLLLVFRTSKQIEQKMKNKK